MTHMPPAFLVVPRPTGDPFVCDRSQVQEACRAYIARARIAPDSMLMLDIADAYAGYLKLLGGRQVLTLQEIGTCASVGYQTAHDWLRREFIRASISGRVGSGGHLQFSPWDGFVAGVLGRLSRSGCVRSTMEQASKLLYLKSKKKSVNTTNR